MISSPQLLTTVLSGNTVLPAANTQLDHVLVLEDNFLIALETEFILNGLGARNIHIAATVAEAAAVLESIPLDFALLDVNLGHENSLDFAVKLKERGIPFGFCSGYGDGITGPNVLNDVPRISKPFDSEAVGSLVAAALGRPAV